MAARERETARTTEKGHGRLERRTLTVTGALAQYLDWPGARQAFRLVRERTVRGQTAREVVYGITSLPRERAGAQALLHLTRQHWGIENKLFYVRDATFGEDACRVRKGRAPEILTVLRNAALALLRGAGCKNIASALRRFSVHYLEALALIRSKTEN